MGFRDLFSKKSDKQQPEQRSLSFEDIGTWAEDTRSSLTDNMLNKCAPHGEHIDTLFEDIEAIVAALEGKELEEELIKRLETITITSKKSYCSAMSSLLGKRPRYSASKAEDIKAYGEGIQETLLQINKIATSKGRYLAIAFEPEVKEMGRLLKQIAIEANELSVQYSSEAPKLEAVTTIGHLTSEYADMDEDALSRATLAAQRSVETEINSTKTAHAALTTYDKSDKAMAHQADIANLSAMEKEEHDLNLDIYEFIAPVRRIFKKYKNAVDRGVVSLPQKEYSLLEHMGEYPVMALTEDGTLATCKSLMKHIRKALEAATVSEKQSRLEKAVARCKDIENGRMDDMIHNYIGMLKTHKALKGHIANYSDPELDALKAQAKNAEHDLTAAKNSLEEALKAQQDASERRAHIKAEIKRLISEFYGEITLNF